jgi:hypothetical protein
MAEQGVKEIWSLERLPADCWRLTGITIRSNDVAIHP